MTRPRTASPDMPGWSRRRHGRGFVYLDAGRRQYLYHPDWHLRRDRERFVFMLEFAARLRHARKVVSRDLRRPGMPLERATAAAFRLLDLGAFRIGSERYADRTPTT